jgi:hypothetical protein
MSRQGQEILYQNLLVGQLCRRVNGVLIATEEIQRGDDANSLLCCLGQQAHQRIVARLTHVGVAIFAAANCVLRVSFIHSTS